MDGNTFLEVLPFDYIVWEDSKKVNIKYLNFLDLCGMHNQKVRFPQNAKHQMWYFVVLSRENM